MKRIACVFLLAMLIGGFYFSTAHAKPSFGSNCATCHGIATSPPVANAGPDQTVNTVAAVTLKGSSLSDPSGSILTFSWRQTAGAPVTLSNSNSATATFTAPSTAATLTFQLTVADRVKVQGTDTCIVTVNAPPANKAPVANAGADQTVNAGVTVTLNGSNSSDSDGQITKHAWQKITGPAVTLSNPNAAITTFVAPSGTTASSFTFSLTVTDNNGATATDNVIVNVNALVVNKPPVADAGTDLTVAAGDPVSLNGVNSKDPDGSISSYSWKQIGTPAVTLLNPDSAGPSFTAPDVIDATKLTFELTVTDNKGAKATDSVSVNVNPLPKENLSPVANAGDDQSVQAGDDVKLDGTASSDPDGSIASYSWKQTVGPTVTLSSTTVSSPTFTAPIVDAATPLTFELTVTDNEGKTASDLCIVNVSPVDSVPVNEAPLADAGMDQVVDAGDTVTLDGSASIDLDGEITTYQWKQLDGPTVILSDAAAAMPTFTAPPLTSGATLTFKLMVTDDGGSQASDTCVVMVNPAYEEPGNLPPVANAGPDQAVKPRTKVKLTASASTDPDDGIASYRWKQTSGPKVRLSGPKSKHGSKSMDVHFVAPRRAKTTIMVFSLTVTDKTGLSSSDTCTVTVRGHKDHDDDDDDDDDDRGRNLSRDTKCK